MAKKEKQKKVKPVQKDKRADSEKTPKKQTAHTNQGTYVDQHGHLVRGLFC